MTKTDMILNLLQTVIDMNKENYLSIPIENTDPINKIKSMISDWFTDDVIKSIERDYFYTDEEVPQKFKDIIILAKNPDLWKYYDEDPEQMGEYDDERGWVFNCFLSDNEEELVLELNVITNSNDTEILRYDFCGR